MKVLVGPAFTIEVPSSPPHAPVAYDGDRPVSGDGEREAPKSFFEDGSGFQVEGKPGFFAGDSSESSSSIGTPDDSDDENDDVSCNKEEEEEEEEEEVQSKLKGLGSLDSLEDSLPIKSVSLLNLFRFFFPFSIFYERFFFFGNFCYFFCCNLFVFFLLIGTLI